MATSTAALAPRESFGDRKLPEISRKIKACVACRKLKIKCHINDGSPPRTRCKARGLSCAINKSLQTLLESDASWKEAVELRIEALELVFAQDARPGSERRSRAPTSCTPGLDPVQATASSAGAIHVDGAGLDPTCSPAALPAASITSIAANAQSSTSEPACKPEMIPDATISAGQAKEAFAFYKQHMDALVHYILADIDMLSELRQRSSLLTIALCTVSFFCTGSEAYPRCLDVLKRATTPLLFATEYSWDDVRALCLGAFWLNEISVTLNGLAVRIALQRDLHRCITKMTHTKKICYERTRLYFLVCVCDHHCSLIHGRPPMGQEWKVLKEPRAFLESPHAKTADAALINQIEFCSISRRVFESFGADVEKPVAAQCNMLKNLEQEFDDWYHRWSSSQSSPHASWSRQDLDFHWYSGKLYLFSHIFRGPRDASSSDPIDQDFVDAAIKSALAVVSVIIGLQDTTGNLATLPVYYGNLAIGQQEHRLGPLHHRRAKSPGAPLAVLSEPRKPDFSRYWQRSGVCRNTAELRSSGRSQ